MCRLTAWWFGGRTGDIFHDNKNKRFLPAGVANHPAIPKVAEGVLVLQGENLENDTAAAFLWEKGADFLVMSLFFLDANLIIKHHYYISKSQNNLLK